MLLEAAVASLRNAIRLGDQRSAANDLLAADALFTYACEYANDKSLPALQQLTEKLDLRFFESRVLSAHEP